MTEGRKRSTVRRRGPESGMGGATGTPNKTLRPAQCRAYMRRTLAQEFPGIVDGFVKKAKSGNCQHVKLATELLAPKPRVKQARSGRGTIAGWLEQMKQGSQQG